MTPAEARPLTPAQRRALEAVRDGRVYLEWREAMDLLSMGLAKREGDWTGRRRWALTDAGWEALND